MERLNPTSTILIVDDEPMSSKTLAGILRSQDYQIVFASDGREALKKAAEIAPDLILLDVMLPEMDGFEVCRHLRGDPVLAEVPIILVTALDDRDSRVQGMEAGADDFVTKPIDRVELRARVRTITRLNRYRRLLMERTQRQHAEEEMQRRNRELLLLNHLIVTAASTLDTYEALQGACQALAHAFDLPSAAAMLLDEARQECSVVAEYSFPVSGSGDESGGARLINQRSSLLGQVFSVAESPVVEYILLHKVPLVASDAQNDPRLVRSHMALCDQGVVSLMSVPILTRDAVVGTLDVVVHQRREFSNLDVALAQSVATAVGQAMETAQLYQKLRRHAADLEGIVVQRTVELQTERDRTRAILEALGEAVVVANQEGLIQYINPATVALTGFSVADAMGQWWCWWQSDHQPVDFGAQIQSLVLAGHIWRGEVIQRRKDGSLYPAALTVAPLFDQDAPERVVGFVSVQRDITLLKEAARLKDQFASNVSHELRTPLSVITMLVGNLDMLFPRLDDAKRLAMIRDIREQTRVLNDLISDVLEISRIDSGSLPSERQRVDLAVIMREEAERQLPLARKKRHTVQIAGAERLVVRGSEGQLRQIIRNVLNNAIKYTAEGGRIACECREFHRSLVEERRDAVHGFDRARSSGRVILLSGDSDLLSVWPGSDELPFDHWAALRIVDTGVGIGDEELPHIFERFYRVRSQGTIPGTGLGLSIARELIELHDGQIVVASAPGVGSNFTIYLPLAGGGCS